MRVYQVRPFSTYVLHHCMHARWYCSNQEMPWLCWMVGCFKPDTVVMCLCPPGLLWCMWSFLSHQGSHLRYLVLKEFLV